MGGGDSVRGHSLSLECVVRAPVVEVVADAADDQSQDLHFGERLLETCSL